MLAAKQPTKPAVTPSVKMKSLHWKRVLIDKLPDTKKAPGEGVGGGAAASPARTVWHTLGDEMPFHVEKFEAQFNASRSATDGGARVGGRSNKPAVTKALDPKRSNAVSIMMSSLPPVDEVKAAIGSLNERVISLERLEQLRAQLLTAEEEEQ